MSAESKYTAHLTDAHSRKTRVIFYDKFNESYSEETLITNAELAKHYNEYRVLGNKQGITVVVL
jgi:hypothetical protein